MLLPDTTAQEAAALAELVRRDAKLNVASLTVSQGVASAVGTDAAPRTLMHEADRELYRAKGTRDAVCVGGRSARAPHLPTQREDHERGGAPYRVPGV
jgi:PleD family two-component response regulator